jgi:hypothetical protein
LGSGIQRSQPFREGEALVVERALVTFPHRGATTPDD